MTVHDAEPGDVYVDGSGKLWRCVSICREPTVTMEEVEGHTSTPPDPMVLQAAGAQQYRPPVAPPIIRDCFRGGVSGLMWSGWKRIWRKEKAEPARLADEPVGDREVTMTKDLIDERRARFDRLVESSGQLGLHQALRESAEKNPRLRSDEKTGRQWQDEYNKANGPVPWQGG